MHNTPVVRRRQLLIVRRRESRGVAGSRCKVFPLGLVQGWRGAIPAPAQRKRSERRSVGGSPQVADGEALTPAVRELSSGLAFFIGIARAGAWQNPMKSTSSGNAASTPDIAEKKNGGKCEPGWGECKTPVTTACPEGRWRRNLPYLGQIIDSHSMT